LAPLPGDPAASPPAPARKSELEAFSKVAIACLEAELFTALTDILRDERLKPALGALLKGGDAIGPALEQSLKGAGIEGRTAIVALLRNIAVSIAAPGFDPKPLVDMLTGLAGDSATIKALRDLVALALLGVDGETDVARVGAVSVFVGCFVQVDETFALPAYFYDVAAGGALTAAFAAIPTTAGAEQARVDALVAALNVVSYLTDSLATDQQARDALGQAGALILRPDLAIEAIPEVVSLLKSDALSGLPSLFSDIATRPCLKLAPK
jgi:hypothetical protein